MPGMDEDACEIDSVIWNDPFVSVQLYNAFGMSSDSIKLYQQDTNSLWELMTVDEKLKVDKEYKALYDEVTNDQLYKVLKGDLKYLILPTTKTPVGESSALVSKIIRYYSNAKLEKNGNTSCLYRLNYSICNNFVQSSDWLL